MVQRIHHGGNVEKIAASMDIPIKDFKDFSANINPLGFPRSLRALLVQSLSKIQTYPDPSYSNLKSALAAHFGLSKDDIFVGNGATELLDESICAQKATDAVILAPTFGEYERLFKRQGINVHHYQLKEANDFALKIQDLIKYLRSHSIIEIICLTNPNNPTGALVPANDIRKLVNFCNEHHLLLILDEAFIDLTVGRQASFAQQMTANDQVYLIRAATKFFGIPGLRLGYCFTKNKQLQNLLRKQEDAWSVNALADVFGQHMFAAEKYIALTHQWLNEEQPALYEELKKMRGIKVFPSKTNFFLFRCEDTELRSQLLKKRIIIRQCDDYVGLGANYYRVAVKNHEDNALLVKSLRQVLGDDQQ